MTDRPSPAALLAALVLEDGALWGDRAVGFQREDARAIFDDDGPRWHFLTRPRGGSKSSDLAAVLLVWLVCIAVSGERGYIAAADKDQSKFAVLDALGGFVERTPALRGLVTVQTDKIVAASGATVEVLSADGASAHGLRPSIIVVDEAAQWPSTRNGKKMWAALVSSLAKVPGCRFVVLTSAGEPQHWCYGVLKAARKSADWHVNEVPGPLEWLDPAKLEAQRPLLLDSEFSQYHLNLWVESEDRLVSEADLMAAVGDRTPDDPPAQPVPGTKYVIACDLGLVNDPTVAVVAHVIADPDNRGAPRTIVIDRIARWQGSHRKPVRITEDVEPWLLSASKEFGRAPVVIDSWNAAGLVERLGGMHIRATEVKLSEPVVGRIGTSLHLAFRERRIHIPNDEKLLAELRTVRLRRTNFGDFRLDHDRGGAHDDQAMACGLAVVELAAPRPRTGMILLSDEEWAERERAQALATARALGRVPEPVKQMGTIGGAPDWSTGLARPDDEGDQSLNGQTKPSPFV
jgi:hypothetical protein